MIKGRWKKMNKHRKRVFAAALAVAVAGTSFNVASLAVSADNSKDGRVIRSFEGLEDDVAYQYLPVGSYESDIIFPDELKVIVYSSDSEPEPSPEKPEDPEAPEPSPENPEDPEAPVPSPENPEDPEAPVPSPENPEDPEAPEPSPENPEDPEAPGPVSENGNGEGTDDSTVSETGENDFSASIRNPFGVMTVYAAEGGETGTKEPVDPENPAPEDGEEPGTEPEEPLPENPAPPEPENPDPEKPGDDNGQDPETDGQVSDNTPSPEDETVEPETPEDEKNPEVIGGEEEKILTNVKWKLVRDLSAYRRFEALLEGDVFVYEPDISRYPLTSEADLPQIKVTITAKDDEGVSENDTDGTVSDNLPEDAAGYPEFSRMMISGGVRIRVEAPQGVFPEGAEISVKKIDDEASTEKIRSAVGAGANVAAFDITVKDVSGNEIQPRTEYGLPVVTFENVNIVKESADSDGAGVFVYHFEDGFESPERLDAEVDALQGSAAVEAEHFSPFVVVVDGDVEEPAGDIKKSSLSDNRASVILDPKQFSVAEVSTEKPVKPPVKVTWKNGTGKEEVLEEGIDYILEYSDNTKSGTAKVTVKGIGGYEGERSEAFDIIKGSKEPTILYRGENETVSGDKPKAWYNTGVHFSGKPEGKLTYKAKLEEGVYGSETEPLRKEGEGVAAKIFLSSNNSTVYFVTRNVNIDLTAPEGNIVIGKDTYRGLSNNGKIVSYVNSPDEVYAQGTDKISGVSSYGLLLTESPAIKSLSNLQDMDDGEWMPCVGQDPIPLVENKNNFIYVKVRDKAGNAGFASAPGICYDTVPPVLGKVEITTVNGKLIATFTASDSLSGIDKYYVLIQNMSAAAPTKNAVLKGKSSDVSTIDLGAPQNGKVLYCVVTDKAGNVSDIFKVNTGGNTGTPEGSIAIMGKTWNSLQKQAKTAAYTREKQLITITGTDNVSGIDKIEYLITPKFYASTAELSSLSANLWKTYNKEQQPEIEHNVLNYVYAKITNNAGSVCYISSEGICHDRIKPVVTKVAASKEKASSVTVVITGTDELSGIDSYYAMAKKIDEDAPESKTVESSGKRSETDTFDLTGLTAATDYKAYGIIKDKAGNLSEVKYQTFATRKAASSNSSSKKDSKSDSSGKGSGNKKDGSKTNANAKDKNKNSSSSNGAGAGKGSGSENGVSGNGSGASGAPFIEDASSGIATGKQLTSGWDRIEGESLKAAEPSEIFVQMNVETVVPADLLKDIAKKNVTIHFEMNDDLLWTINGLSFTADPESDIDLSVRKDSRNIPSKLVENTADIYPHTTISLGYTGDFGFKAVLSVPLGSEYAGMTAGRYYYDETANRLDFVDMAPISNQGRCEFEFTHASDYLIVVMPGSVEENMQLIANSGPDSGDLPGGDDKLIKPKMDLKAFFSWDNKNLWILVVSLLSLVLCAVVLFAPENRRKLA